MTSLLWVALLGFQSGCYPYNDMLLQAALSINAVQISFRGTNLSLEFRRRSEADIKTLEKLAFNAGLYMSEALVITISTKTNRLMRHIVHQVRHYGFARK